MAACDIAIIGAGPAGALSAYLLAQARPAADIVLLDAGVGPRHRPCGEYLSPGSLGSLQRAGLLAAVTATGAQRLAGVALCGPHGGHPVAFAPVLGLHPAVDHGLGVRRERFDRVLQEAAAQRCQLWREAQVAGVERSAHGWTVRLTDGRSLDAGLVVGADGRGSVVRRACGLDQRPARQRFALVARAHGVLHRNIVEMHLGPLGQLGLCPLGEGEVNLNLLLAPASSVLLRRMPRDALLRAAVASTAGLAGRAHGLELGQVMATGSLPQGCTAVSAEGVALVGDAAGFCDPFTGEGMGLAMRGAELLAAALVEGGGGLPAYARAYAGSLGRRRQVGTMLQRLLDRRRLAEGVAAGLASLPLLSRLLIADAAGFTRRSVEGRPAA